MRGALLARCICPSNPFSLNPHFLRPPLLCRTGKPIATLRGKAEELAARPGIQDDHMYLAELRYHTKYRHATRGDWVKTLLTSDLKDFIGPQQSDSTLYWDRFDEGVFVGGANSGSPLHVDQVQWSNIGKVRPRRSGVRADILHKSVRRDP